MVARSDAEPASAPQAVGNDEDPPVGWASRVRLIPLSKVPRADFPVDRP